MKSDYEYCQDCGEHTDECVCRPVQSQEVDTSDWKFEYAFESITDKNGFFKRNMPMS